MSLLRNGTCLGTDPDYDMFNAGSLHAGYILTPSAGFPELGLAAPGDGSGITVTVGDIMI